jgi:SSS family transporter
MSALPAFYAIQNEALPRQAHPAIWWVGLAYFAVVAAIGVWAARRTRTARDFFVAGNGIGLWTTAIAAMAATISGFTFIGGPGLVYNTGFGAMFIMLPAAITGALGACVLAKRMRLLAEFRGVVTIPHAIGLRYASPAARGLSGVAILIAVIGYMGAQILALGIVVDAIFGIGLRNSIWIGAAVTLSYSATGGILAGVYTDLFQGLLMAFASVLVFLLTLRAGGGMTQISTTLLERAPALMSPWGTMGPISALSLFFVFGIGSLGQPHVIHKFYMIRDPRKLKWLPLILTTSIMMTALLYFGVGIAMRAMTETGAMPNLGDTPDRVTPLFLLQKTPVLLAGLVFAGVAAAIMSTVNSFLNIGAAALTYDIPAGLGMEAEDADRSLRRGRLWTVAITILATLIAQRSGALVILLGLFGWGLFSSTIVPALAVGLNWDGATREGAIASIVTGLITSVSLELLNYRTIAVIRLPAGVSASGISLVLSMLVFFVVSHATRSAARKRIADPIVTLVMSA